MAKAKLRVTLVGASIIRESELPGFEMVTDFASVSFNLAIASLKAAADADARLTGKASIRLLDFGLGWDHRELGAREADAVAETQPDLVGISCYCWNVDTLLELAAAVRARCPGAFVVLGGPSAGPVARELLEAHAAVDAVVVGEGENVFKELLCALLAARGLGEVAGVSWRDVTGAIVENPEPKQPVDVSELPSPYQSGVLEPASFMLLETSRGCRYRCRFCSWMGGGRRLRYVPAASVEADLRWAREHGVRSIKLADTAINFHTERVAELAGAIRAADPDGQLRFTYFLKPELLDEEQVRVLEQIPTEEIIVGVESLGDAARRAVGKPPFVAEEFERKVEMLRRVGPVTASFILGLPGDTLEGLERTLDWIVEFDERHPDRLHVICLFWLAVLPGAKLYEKRNEGGFRLATHETPYLLESAEHSPDDLLMMARRSVERHYRHPKLRVEYFHKEYLMQDAPATDRHVTIARRADDSRRRVLLVGAVASAGERGGERPYCLQTAWMKAYAETSDAVRRSFCIQRMDVREPASGEPLSEDDLAEIVGAAPEVLVWCSTTGRPVRAEATLAALRERLPEAKLLVAGPGVERRVSELEQRVSAVVVQGDPEPALRGLLETGELPPPTRLGSLDDVPSPFQWGFVQRSGHTIRMQLGRDGERFHGSERIYADVRWAIEQRHQQIGWLDESLPVDLDVLERFVDAVTRADPEGRLRHAYRLGPSACTPAHLELLMRVPAGQVAIGRGLERTLERRFVERTGARLVRPEPWLEARTLEALLGRWQRGVEGWTLDEIVPGSVRPGVARLHFVFQHGGSAWLLLGRREGAYRTGLRLERGAEPPPKPALERLVWLVRNSLNHGEAELRRRRLGRSA